MSVVNKAWFLLVHFCNHSRGGIVIWMRNCIPLTTFYSYICTHARFKGQLQLRVWLSYDIHSEFRNCKVLLCYYLPRTKLVYYISIGWKCPWDIQFSHSQRCINIVVSLNFTFASLPCICPLGWRKQVVRRRRYANLHWWQRNLENIWYLVVCPVLGDNQVRLPWTVDVLV